MKQDGLDDFVQALYGDLRRIASRQLSGERPNHTLQPTALLHEAYVKLSGDAQRQFTDRTHFLAIASRVMRQVLVDYARARAAEKRSGGKTQVFGHTKPVEVLELDCALEALAREDADLAELIQLRYFGGLTAEETAEVLDRSVHVVRHDLRLAHAWLRRKLERKIA